MHSYRLQLEAQIKQQCVNKKVFLLVSGGVDSTVAFALLKSYFRKIKSCGVTY